MSEPLRDKIKADPEVAALLAGDPFHAAILNELIDTYAAEVTAQHDALLGDLDNWKPTGILGATGIVQP